MSVQLSVNSMKIWESRYYDQDQNEKSPQDVMRRVSGGSKEYFQVMDDGLFLPNSPTLFNLGTKSGGTSSACFVFDISDSLNGDWPAGGAREFDVNSIMGTAFKASTVAKAGGGVGYYLGNIRPKGDPVRSTHKKACGPVQVLKWLNGLGDLITQGGKRALAQMAVLNSDHQDVLEFINCKNDDPQGIGNFNISVSWKDRFLQLVDFEAGPDGRTGGNVETVKWWTQCLSAWRQGCPGNLFWDTINAANATPHLGNIEATNPCGETPNLSDEPCNLGSMALWRMMVPDGRKYKLDWDRLTATTRTCIRFLDDILDWNRFPHPDITKAALATRKLGLGVMGWADCLAMSHIPYDSQQALDLADEVMRTINTMALHESALLAKRKGTYAAWKPESQPAWVPFARNSTRTSIAPTGTITILTDCSGYGIEPFYAMEADRMTYDGIKLEDKIRCAHLLNGHRPKFAEEIHWSWHVRMQAAFQKHTNLGVSKTINMPNSATVEDVSGAYKLMHGLGCKGGTIFRDGCRNEQVVVKRKTKSVYTTGTGVTAEGLSPLGEKVVPAVVDKLVRDGVTPEPAYNATTLPKSEWLTIDEKVHITPDQAEAVLGVEGRQWSPLTKEIVDRIDLVMDRFEKAGDDSLKAGEPEGTGYLSMAQKITTGVPISYPQVEVPLTKEIVDQVMGRFEKADDGFPRTETLIGIPEKLPSERTGHTKKFKIGGVKGYVTANTYPDGRVGEIFLTVSKAGSTLNGMMDTWAKSFSNALQSGKKLEELVRLHKGDQFEPRGLTGDKDIQTCTSIPDYVVRWLEVRFLKKEEVFGVPRMQPVHDKIRNMVAETDEKTTFASGEFCPDCSSPLVRREGCMACSSCHYTRC